MTIFVSQDQSPQAVDACHDLIVWILPKLDLIPRQRRFTLGSRIEALLLEVLERLIQASYAQPAEKRRHLEAANTKLDLLRHLWRVAFELKAIPAKAHRFGAERMLDIGKQIGGWKKSSPS